MNSLNLLADYKMYTIVYILTYFDIQYYKYKIEIVTE